MFSHSFVEGGGGTYPQASLDRGEYMSTSGFGPGGYICEPVRTGGSTNPLADLDRGVHIRSRIWPGGGSKSGGVQICKDTGFPGEKSGLKYPQLLQSLLSMNQVKILRALVCKNQTNPKFRGKGEKFDFFLICIRRVVTQCKSYNGKLFFRG